MLQILSLTLLHRYC